MNYGQGNLDFKRILSVVLKDVNITIEISKISKTSLDDYVEDVYYLKNILSNYNNLKH